MTDLTPLSPAAQAVLDATSGTFGNYQFGARKQMLASAFRVAAAYLPSSAMYPSSDWGRGWRTGISDARQELLAIAAELEGHHTPAWDGGPLRHWTPTPHTRQELRNIAAELEGGTSTGSTH